MRLEAYSQLISCDYLRKHIFSIINDMRFILIEGFSKLSINMLLWQVHINRRL